MNQQELANTITKMKQEIQSNIAVNDEVVCGLCDGLISYAQKQKDWEAVAYGYVWRADYFFYVKGDSKSVAHELEQAKQSLNEEHPSELLEKYYTLTRLYYESLYDVRTAFTYCLKALNVAEQLNLKHRIGAHYGQIGTYYQDHGCYEEGLQHTLQALVALRSAEESKPRIVRILLSNIASMYLKQDQPQQARLALEEMSQLPLEESDLKIYLDYGYLLYYAKIQETEKCLFHFQEMLDNHMMEFPSRGYLVEFLHNIAEAMMEIHHQQKAKEVLTLLEGVIHAEEWKPLLALCTLQIRYAQEFGILTELHAHYRHFYKLFYKVEEENNRLLLDGMQSQEKIVETNAQCELSQIAVQELNQLVNRDELTQLYNRHYLKQKQDEVLHSQRYQTFGFIILDMDYFKEYNDFYGHLAGDEALRQVANCLRENAQERMEFFRYGGDEFVCLCWDKSEEEMKIFVSQVQSTLEGKKIEHLPSRCAKWVTLSIGYGASSIASRMDALALFDVVDNALYFAKSTGRNNAKSILSLEAFTGGSHAQ